MRLLLSMVTIGMVMWSPGYADVAIISHPSLPLKTLTIDEAQRLFLKRKTRIESGIALDIRVLPASSRASKTINQKVLGMTESRVLAYWAKNIFTGQARPPQEMRTEEELKRWIARTPNALGYIDIMNVDDQVKVLLTVPQ